MMKAVEFFGTLASIYKRVDGLHFAQLVPMQRMIFIELGKIIYLIIDFEYIITIQKNN
jgi:hypothetical protein